MLTTVAEIGRWLRSRRRDLEISQAKLAEMVGVRSTLVGAWERGETPTTRAQARAIGRALDLDRDQVNSILAVSVVAPPPAPVTDIRVDLTGVPGNGNGRNGNGTSPNGHSAPDDSVISLEILGASGDPWADSPPPTPIDVPTAFSGPVGILHEGASPPDLTELRRSAASVDLVEADRRRRQAERLRRREKDRDRRAAVRDEVAKRRREALAAYRSKIESDRREALTAPGATHGVGSVFPMPKARDMEERVTYSSSEQTFGEHPSDRLVYLSRRLRVLVVLLALGALLIWAVVELGDGWGALIDLFTGGSGEEIVDDAVGGALDSFG